MNTSEVPNSEQNSKPFVQKSSGRILCKINQLFRPGSRNIDAWPEGLTEEQILAVRRDLSVSPKNARCIAERLIISGQGIEKGQKWVDGERVWVVDPAEDTPIEIFAYGKFTTEVSGKRLDHDVNETEKGYSFSLSSDHQKLKGIFYILSDCLGKDGSHSAFGLDFECGGVDVLEGNWRGIYPQQQEMLRAMRRTLEIVGDSLGTEHPTLSKMREILDAPFTPLSGNNWIGQGAGTFPPHGLIGSSF